MKTKAQASIVPLILGIGVALILVIVLGVMLGSTFDHVEEDIQEIGDNDYISDTFTASNTTAIYLDHFLVQSGTLSIANVSTNTRIGVGNFTIDYDAGSLLLDTDAYNGWPMTANYTWGGKEIRDNVMAGAVAGYNAYEKTTSYMPLFVIAIVIAFILTIVLGFTMLKKGGSSGGQPL